MNSRLIRYVLLASFSYMHGMKHEIKPITPCFYASLYELGLADNNIPPFVYDMFYKHYIAQEPSIPAIAHDKFQAIVRFLDNNYVTIAQRETGVASIVTLQIVQKKILVDKKQVTQPHYNSSSLILHKGEPGNCTCCQKNNPEYYEKKNFEYYD